MKKASVVVPTYNRWSSLQSCLDALLCQALAHDDYEIIVVADGSTDGTGRGMPSYTSDPRVRFLQQSRRGFAAAMNSAIRVASGEIVVLIQDDCICEPGLVAAHIAAHACDERLVLLGPVFPHPECPRTAVTALLRERGQHDFIRLTMEGPGLSDLALRANSSVRRSLLQKNPFDESYLRHAEAEHAYRLQQAGAQVRYAPTAVAYRLYDQTPDAMVSDARELSAFEVSFARSQPAYRAMSSIAKWDQDIARKRVLRSLMARLPFSLEPILKPLFRVVHSFRRNAFFLRAAQRLLKLRVEAAACRGAVSAAGSWTKLQASFLVRVPILLYHLVTSDADSSPTALSMTGSTFERQMRWLAKGGYRSIGIAEFIAWREGDFQLPPKPVLITFDDAYDDTAQSAFPILQRFGFSAVCMVVTGEIAKFNQWDVKLGWKPRALMNEEALLQWKEHGIEYGAHSCSHPDLRTLHESDLQHELAVSRDALGEIVGSPVRTFAYPYGYFDRGVREQAARYFDFAFTTEPRPSSLATDPFLLGRMEPMSSDSYFDFVSRVRWGWTPKLKLRAAFGNALHRALGPLRLTKAGRALAHPEA